jgi:putative FmdB family regulatory protein
MPTYEYRCPNGHDFEKFFRSMSAAERATSIACPTCGAIALRQLSSSAGLLFKGSGFYLTDYGKNAHGKKAPPAPAGSSEGGSSGTGDSGSGAGSSDSGSSGSGSGDSGSGSSDAKRSDSSSSGDCNRASDAPKKAEKPAEKTSTPIKPSSGKPKE